MYSADHAQYACDFIECLTHSDGQFSGKPFTLFPWQKAVIDPFYGELRPDARRQYQYLYLEIPKKNGKSELAAALGVFHTYGDGELNGEVYICAADRENAGIVFNAALTMVRASPELSARSRIIESMKTIIDLETGTKMKVMSSEAYSKHGYKPSCVIFDELHSQPNRGLWDIMTFGSGSARLQPVWIVLTTAGDDPDRKSIGWEVHEKAKKILDIRAGRVEGEDFPTWLPIIHGYEGEDIYNEENWYKANPSLGLTIQIDTLREEALDAKASPARERLFRWLRLNQWIALKRVGWLPITLFDKTQSKIDRDRLRDELCGLRCYLGLDLSSTTDLTACVALFPPQEGLEKWTAIFDAWIPEESMIERERRDHVPFRLWVDAGMLNATQGEAVDYSEIEAAILRMMSTYEVALMGTDQWNSRMLTQRLMDQGLGVIEIAQNYQGMSVPMKDMERKLLNGEMEHEENPVARWCFGNTVVSMDGNENIKTMKNKSIDRIDITVAWINALAAALSDMEDAMSVYDTRGLVVF